MGKKARSKKLDKIEERYDSLCKDRHDYLERGRDYSELSVPYLLPRTKDESSASMKSGHQSLTSEAVNTLSSKFVQALFPVNTPFFSLGLDSAKLSEIEAKDVGKKEATLLPYTQEITRLAMKKFNEIKMRPALASYARHLVVSGNSCIIFLETGVKQLGLDKYVTKRDSTGRLIEAITKEELEITTLPNDIAEKVSAEKNKADEDDTAVTVYTQYKRIDNENFNIVQFVENEEVSNTPVKEKMLPAVFGIWNYVAGEHYGRGEVENYSGDFTMYEFLSEYRARGAATILDVKWLVRPGSLTDVETLNKAQSGDYVSGQKDDIVALQLDKYPDTKFISEVIADYKERISKAFLMLTGVIRDSERTTAFEIDRVIAELESVKVGVYSSQVQELQKPIAVQLLDMLNPDLVDTPLEIKIDSGLESIGKSADIQKVRQYTEIMSLPATWPQELAQMTDMKAFSDFISDRLYLNTSSFFKDPDKVAQEGDSEGAAIANEEVIKQVAGGIGAGLGKNIEENM